ncbi:Cobalt-zinc-cadmium resistance protein [Paramagnetospirillum magnetotacticum MS-1]|uniref:Cobalt-zinc-cadmium resistance protein n=1 Tax=Paramagnetospirillum magnetotacticum MS-1 TaxID=272627 RepID=A0A0C2V1C0_PARME|nr:cation diffusion facilitator family transporter [Paramagnetospirillum magnetotacticum]KIL98876.1 Cobalt-zinc-cadmium resistance protein [Paramagnetospirillum magnetotacticum MS-1]
MSTNAKESVAISSVLASAAMTVMKLVVGLMTGSLGILSEAAHSLLDMGAALLTWFAVRIGDQPADERHPYGHGKVESVSALIETGLLFVTAAWIIKEAVSRLLESTPPEVETTWWAVAVIVVSIIIDIGRSRALLKVAKETGSQALEADALHFSSDILSSTAVLIGLGLVWLGWPKGDAVAALGVAGFVLLAGWRLGTRTIDVLVDAAPQGIAEHIEKMAAQLPGIARVERVRARPAGPAVFAEVVVKVSRTLHLEQVESLRRAVLDRLRAELPEVQAVVIAEPLALDDESLAETVRVLAAARGLSVHHVGVATLNDRPHLSFDIEVDETLTIAAAHAVATELEQALAAELGDDVTIDTHIDPRRASNFSGAAPAGNRLAEVRDALATASKGLVDQVHQIEAQEREDGLYVSLHCLFPDDAPIGEVHHATARLEHRLRDAVRGIARVVVRAEPASEGLTG